MSGPTIAMHHVRAALSGAERHGIDTVPLLQTARIPPLLLADDRARVTPEQFTRLVKALHRATDDEFLGLGPVPSRRGTFAMMCHACLGCRDLGSALERAARFYGLFPGGPEIAVETGAGPWGSLRSSEAERGGGPPEAVFSLRSDLRRYDQGNFLAECAVIIWHRLSSWLIGRRIPLRWAQFAHPAPAHASEYDVLFACPVRFGAGRTAAGWGAHWLAAPVVRDETAPAAMLRQAPAGLLSRRDYGTTVTEQVRRSLVQALRDRPRRGCRSSARSRPGRHSARRRCGAASRPRAPRTSGSRTRCAGTRRSARRPRGGSPSRNSPRGSASPRTPPSTGHSGGGRAPLPVPTG